MQQDYILIVFLILKLLITEQGKYILTLISDIQHCTPVSDTITIQSSLPTADSGTICNNVASFRIKNNLGKVAWYKSADMLKDTIPLNVGTSINITLADFDPASGDSSVTIYAEDHTLYTCKRVPVTAYIDPLCRLTSVFGRNNLATSVMVYPNPFSDHISFIVDNGIVFNTAEISTMDGKTLFTVPLDHQKGMISTAALPKGAYFIKFVSGDKMVVKYLVK